MKKLLSILLAVVVLTACGNSQNASVKASVETSQSEYVEVLYFHGKQRCITCNAIEKLMKEVVEENFAEQLKSGKVIFKVVDISTQEGEKIADNYEVTWSSLFINKWDNGKESRNNMTDFGFSYAKNSPDTFKSGAKNKIDELLK